MDSVDPHADDTLSVEVQSESNGPVVLVAGELDLANAHRLEDAVAGALKQARSERIVFDFSKLTFLDSSGLGVLLRVVALDVQVAIRNPTMMVREIIDATGLGNVLLVEEGF